MTDTCLTQEQLYALLAKRLPASELAESTRHFDSCAKCQERAEHLLRETHDALQQKWGAGGLTEPDPAAALPQDASTASGIPEATVLEEDLRPIQSAGTNLPQKPLDGRFDLRRRVGMGGCGTVFEAWDLLLQRTVAVKVPHWTLVENRSLHQRFVVEARAAARLNHANIVTVHEARLEGTVPAYLVSEFISGPSLEVWLRCRQRDGEQVSARQTAEIVWNLAQGVQAAHLAGVLHRDLKPSNVLLAPQAAGGLPFTPRITDFGLARLSEEVTATSMEGRVFGSLQYMAPEQATGREVGPPCDVYALGAILYELLTGQLPINADTPPAMLAAIASQEVLPPRRHRPDIPADIEAVCLKCLEKSPQKRYASVAGLASDLHAFLSGEPVVARLPNLREQAYRWVEHHPTASSMLGVITLAVLAVVAVLSESNRRQLLLIKELEGLTTTLTEKNAELETINRRREEALETAGTLQARIELQQQATQQRLYVSEFRGAMVALQEQDLVEVHGILDRLDQAEFQNLRGVECDWLRTRVTRPSRELTSFPQAAYVIAFSPDASTLVASGQDAIVRQIRYPEAVPIAEWSTGQIEVNCLVFTPDGKSLYTSGDDGTIRQWDLETRQERFKCVANRSGPVFTLKLLPEENLLIAAGGDGQITFWSADTGEPRGAFRAHADSLLSMTLHPDGKRLYTTGRDGLLCCWNLRERTLISSLNLPTKGRDVLISRDGRWLIVALVNRHVEVRDADSGEVAESRTLPDEVRLLVQHPTEDQVYAIDEQGVLQRFPVVGTNSGSRGSPAERTDEQFLCRTHASRVFSALFSPDGRELLTTGGDGRVMAWSQVALDPADDTKTELLERARRLRFNSAGTRLAIQQDEGILGPAITEFAVPGLRPVRTLVSRPGRVLQTINYLADGGLVTIDQADDGTYFLAMRRSSDWVPTNEEPLLIPEGAPSWTLVDISRNLALVACVQASHFHVVGLDPLRLVDSLQIESNFGVAAVDPQKGRFAHCNGSQIFVRDVLSRNILWNVTTPQVADDMLFSPDGNLLISSTPDRVIRVWDATTGTRRSEMSGHRARVAQLAITRDGRTLFSGDTEGEIKIWQVHSGELLGTLTRISGQEIRGLAVSPAGDRLAVLVGTNQLQILPLKGSAISR